MTDGELRSIWRTHLPFVHWQSIESPLTGKGIPDSNYCYDGVEGWIENKKMHHGRVTVRPEQVAWMERRTRCGGRVMLAVRQGPTDGLKLYSAAAARLFLTSKEPYIPALGHWPGGPALWDWPKIADLLGFPYRLTR